MIPSAIYHHHHHHHWKSTVGGADASAIVECRGRYIDYLHPYYRSRWEDHNSRRGIANNLFVMSRRRWKNHSTHGIHIT